MLKFKKLKYLIIPFLFGCLFVLAPLVLNLFLLIGFIVFEIMFIRKNGFFWLGAKRVSLFFAIVLAGYLAPLKYLDQSVETKDFMLSENGYRSVLTSRRINMYFPSVYTENDIKFTEKRMSLKSLIKDIETQTGLQHRVYYCGTGANILYGGHPILGIHFKERTPDKASKFASPSPSPQRDSAKAAAL